MRSPSPGARRFSAGTVVSVAVRVCVFCGSSDGEATIYLDAARDLGRFLAESGIDVVYGGASVGTMNALAEGALRTGGTVIGVIPRTLVDWEVAHSGITELHVVDSMHERKAMMSALSDAFIALPGGIGTLEELFEVWTWRKLGIHAKPIGLLEVAGFFEPLVSFLDQMGSTGFLGSEDRALVQVETDPQVLLKRLLPAN